MFDLIAAIVATLGTVLILTTILLPDRQTPAVLREGSTGLAKVFRATLGMQG